MAIARAFHLGPTYITIDDTEIKNQTKEEARKKWQETSDIAYQALLSQHIAKKRRSGEASADCSRKIATELHNDAMREAGYEKAPKKRQLPKEQNCSGGAKTSSGT